MKTSDHVMSRRDEERQVQILECRHCGGSITIGLPLPLGDFIVLGDAYVRRHRACAPYNGEPRQEGFDA